MHKTRRQFKGAPCRLDGGSSGWNRGLYTLRPHDLAPLPSRQRGLLRARGATAAEPPLTWPERIYDERRPLSAAGIEVLQINLGKVCNQTCRHCHVDAGPDRRESMSAGTIDACLDVLARTGIPTLDITGGAPELNPNFDHLVRSAAALDRHVMDRCNLTVIFEPGKEYLPEFFKRHQVELVCSLPCYSEGNVDKQRGKGTFEASIRALKQLNEIGYGQTDSGLLLNLVDNPVGPHLPPPQEKLEEDYRKVLGAEYGIVFNRLYCLANMPITKPGTTRVAGR